MQQTISRSYIDGIKDARTIIRRIPDLTAGDLLDLLDTEKACLRMASGASKEYHRGAVDFFRNQIKKKSNMATAGRSLAWAEMTRTEKLLNDL